MRAKARELGFTDCGFTSVDQLDCGPLLVRWLDEKRHGFMEYLARDPRRRVEPRRSRSTAATVIVAAWRYDPPPPADPRWREALTGRMAAYALGPDYHRQLSGKLDELAAFIRQDTGAASRAHVDAGPLVEKDLARRAGLGWFGRNTNLLSRADGSYFLLACLLTDARYEPDPPFREDHCGTCAACIPACPTGALDTGPTIDAPRCISYLTIEHRGPIARELRPLMGNWVFGCDVCQEVCPWNPPAGEPVAELAPSLTDLLFMSDEEFRARYRESAVSRAKRRGLARNAAVALGNSGNPDAAAPLEVALRSDREPLVRAHAAWALGRLATTSAYAALRRAAAAPQVRPVQAEIESALNPSE